ncbi:MAG: L,D-transpeptidase family protein [Desulfopila sp.]|jgi:murein L,D-transpeptidase YcbB/YkuD|nr:L,D-transpeptidase family protein [Desulfopila sp.]
MHRTFKIVSISLLCAIFFSSPATAQTEADKLAEAMVEHLSCYPLELVTLGSTKPTLIERDLCLAAIYHETGVRPLWVTEEGPGAPAETALQYLKNSNREGLEPADYQIEQLERLWQNRSVASLARLDTLLTYNVVKYVHDVSFGRLQPYMVNPELFAEAGEKLFDPVAIIRDIQAASNLDQYFQELPPDNSHYEGLKAGLTWYRYLQQAGEWPAIEGGKNLYQADRDSRIPQIRKRLALLLGKSANFEAEDFYDLALEEDVLLFQELHGLKSDGVIGRMTLAELNVTPAERVDQIVINMARWRWQSRNPGKEYVLVNIANFQLYGYREGQLQLSLPVIVGKLQHQTPVFSDHISYVEFHPFWNIPPSIAMNEELPRLRKNPFALVEKNIRLFSSWQADAVELDSTTIDWNSVGRSQMARYKLRQDPGPNNALGRVKFVFPNHYSVYIHDTPAKDLFREKHRFFSHGCIRVSDPGRFAAFVLQGSMPEMDESRIEELMTAETRRIVRVTPPLAIHLTYQTAWLDKDGRIHFNRDIYGRDEKLRQALLSR